MEQSSISADSHTSSTRLGLMRGGPTGGEPIRETSAGGTTMPVGPPGWLAQCRDAPFSGQRYPRLRVVQTRRTGPDGIVGYLG